MEQLQQRERDLMFAKACGWCGLSIGLLLLSGTVGWGADLEVEVRGARPRAGEIHAAVFDQEAFALDTEVRGTISSSGEVSAGVFTREGDFPMPPVDTARVPASGRTLVLKFPGLEPGEYAVGVYQDLNGNNRLDATVARDPTEPWGLSNNARPKDRPPTWDECKFMLPPEGVRIIIELR